MKLSNVLLGSMLAVSASSFTQTKSDSTTTDSLGFEPIEFNCHWRKSNITNIIFTQIEYGPAGEMTTTVVCNYCGMG